MSKTHEIRKEEDEEEEKTEKEKHKVKFIKNKWTEVQVTKNVNRQNLDDYSGFRKK